MYCFGPFLYDIIKVSLPVCQWYFTQCIGYSTNCIGAVTKSIKMGIITVRTVAKTLCKVTLTKS